VSVPTTVTRSDIEANAPAGPALRTEEEETYYIWQLVAVFIAAFFWLIPKSTLGKRAQEKIT
jgi:bacteriorhodopsin